jgi:hypothetical protein
MNYKSLKIELELLKRKLNNMWTPDDDLNPEGEDDNYPDSED